MGLIVRVGIAHCLVQQKEIQHGRLAVTVETLLILNILSVGRGSLDSDFLHGFPGAVAVAGTVLCSFPLHFSPCKALTFHQEYKGFRES